MRLTVRQNLTVFGQALRRARLPARIATLARELDLEDSSIGRPESCPPDRRTRVALAKALINRPEVLLLDEPTASLDPDTADWCGPHLERYRTANGATILLASHNMAEVERMCERVIIMKKGRIEDDGARRRSLPATAAPISKRCSRRRTRAHARGGAMSKREVEDTGAGAGQRVEYGISWRRIAAMVERYRYPSCARRAAPARTHLLAGGADADVGLPPASYIAQNAGFFARASGTFIGAVLLWDILFRGQLGFSVSFLEEMWSRNLANLMMSPLKPVEFVIAMMVMSIIRLVIGMVPVSLLAIAFFGFNLYGLGLALAAFFVNLIITGWAVGIFVSGVVMRNGLGAENLAWTVMFLLMPITCVYYPVAVLPHCSRRWPGAAAHLRVRRHARAHHRSYISGGPDGRSIRSQRGRIRDRGLRHHAASQIGAPPGIADPDRRIVGPIGGYATIRFPCR